MSWTSYQQMKGISYTCGYCGSLTASDEGLGSVDSYKYENGVKGSIYFCSNCERPTYFDEYKKQYPGIRIGNDINGINKDIVLSLYNEIRDSFSISAYTAVALCSRKLLMNISVDLGAEENKTFAYYVNWLDENNYILPNSKKWVDQIRKIGNEATHEIAIISREDAEKTLKFIEILLRIVYELPSMIE